MARITNDKLARLASAIRLYFKRAATEFFASPGWRLRPLSCAGTAYKYLLDLFRAAS
jgi:hypothetical protein